MTGKTHTIVLQTWEMLDPQAPGKTRRVWRVTKVTDSIKISPGDMLDRERVEDLCARKYCRVIITEKA